MICRTLKGFKRKSKEADRLLRSLRAKHCLSPRDFHSIARWKLRGQYNRVLPLLMMNSPGQISNVTRVAFRPPEPTTLSDLGARVKKLRELEGVGIGLASAILALRFPTHACVIDFRGWRQVYDEKRKSFTVNQYLRYVEEVRKSAVKLGWTPLEVDIALWNKDRAESHCA